MERVLAAAWCCPRCDGPRFRRRLRSIAHWSRSAKNASHRKTGYDDRQRYAIYAYMLVRGALCLLMMLAAVACILNPRGTHQL